MVVENQESAPAQVVFVVSAPRSGSTMLARMLARHSQLDGGPEPHLIPPLAHLGVWAEVARAPYDVAAAGTGLRSFTERLPNRREDYWRACRAYCDTLYGAALARSGKRLYVDKTPANALALPFLQRVYPDAKYVALTRHPAAVFVSYAETFFNGDYSEAHRYNPILARYVPALAAFLQQTETPFVHLRYEALAARPEECMRRVCAHVGVRYEPGVIAYGEGGPGAPPEPAGLGDPAAARNTRPLPDAIERWAMALARDPARRSFVERLVNELDPDALAALGYPLETLWAPLADAGQAAAADGDGLQPAPSWYRLQRMAIVRLRAWARQNGLFRKGLEGLRRGVAAVLDD